jgi:glycogen synthase
MRALMTADSLGGVWPYALDLVRGLRGHGIDVVLATMGGQLRDDQRREAASAGLAGLHEGSFRLEWMADPWDDVECAGDWLLALAEDEAADVVHLNSFAHGALDWGRPTIVVAHSDVCSWWAAVHDEEPPEGWRRYRDAVAAGLRSADAVVAPTRAVLADLGRSYGTNDGVVIPNGSSVPEGAEAANEPFVLAAGRLWDAAKNLELLDRAAEGLDWQVVAAGPLGDAAPRHVRPTGRLGHRELADLRSRASIFAAPALYEPFGLAPLEAARACCALVLGDIPSLREVWEDAALYVDPRDEGALRVALQELIADPALRQEMAARARRRAARYGIGPMARAYADLYTRARERTGAPA